MEANDMRKQRSKFATEYYGRYLEREEMAEILDVGTRSVYRVLSGERDAPVGWDLILRNYLRANNRKQDFDPDLAEFSFLDLFSGIGGMRLGAQGAGGACVAACDNDKYAGRVYIHNFTGDYPGHISPDIRTLDPMQLPHAEIVYAGFPCQPFSRLKKDPQGFADPTNSTLFHDLYHILKATRPEAFVLENVANIEKHGKGRTFHTIMEMLSSKDYLGYHCAYKVIEARRYVPQVRERMYIVGLRDKTTFEFPEETSRGRNPVLGDILDVSVDPKYRLSKEAWKSMRAYCESDAGRKKGFRINVVSPNEVAPAITASYSRNPSEILVPTGKSTPPRKLTPVEALRIMGFPEDFALPVSDTQAYRLIGNSVVVPLIRSITARLVNYIC